jgi:hypothetical protein
LKWRALVVDLIELTHLDQPALTFAAHPKALLRSLSPS